MRRVGLGRGNRLTRAARAFHVLAGFLATSAACATARADPQASVGLTASGVIENAAGPRPVAGDLHLGLRGDLLLSRSQPSQMALGPYADVATRGFHDVDVGGGASWLIPASVDFPLVLSAGAFARDGQGRSWQPGAEGTLFGGARSYNFHSAYGMANGFFVQTRWLPSTPSELDVVVGVQLDVEILALPLLLAFEALRH